MKNKFFLFQYQPGDIVSMKKKHPCGSFEWKVEKIGADCKLSCTGCGHVMEMKRENLEKATVKVTRD